jgi:type I restriction enzyme, S subunit
VPKIHLAKETGAQLLERILKERRTRWEEKQLAKFKEQGKTPPKGWQDKYPEPVQPDTTNLPELPEGWVWASLDQLTEFITSGSRGWADYYSNEGALFIRSQNINKDWLDLSDIAFVQPPKSSEGARTRVKANDLLLTITGAKVGKSAQVINDLEEAYVSQHVALIRLVNITLASYAHLFLTSDTGGRGQLNKEAYGAGKPGLNLQQVAAVSIPLPCIDELSKLIGIVEFQLQSISDTMTNIQQSLTQAAAQRKNILKSAFSGQLVPQDPNDEPASLLLERIRAERQKQASTLTRGRKRLNLIKSNKYVMR